MPLSEMNDSAEQPLSLSLNAPNAVTLGRVVLAIVIAWLLIQGGATEILLAGILLIVGWFSDGLDGLLARRMGQSTLAGAIFDLMADRVLMTTTLSIPLLPSPSTRHRASILLQSTGHVQTEGKKNTPEAIRTPAPGSGGRCSIR